MCIWAGSPPTCGCSATTPSIATTGRIRPWRRLPAPEDRVLLTHDLGLLTRRAVIYGAFVRATDPAAQLREIGARLARTADG